MPNINQQNKIRVHRPSQYMYMRSSLFESVIILDILQSSIGA